VNKLKTFVVKQLAKRNIYVSRKFHQNDFTLYRRIQSALMKQSEGVLHIGAHLAQEADFYEENGRSVLWIEANPKIYDELLIRLELFPQQRAICALLGDEDNDEAIFYIANNEGASSSVFNFFDKTSSQVKMVETVNLNMRRLDSILSTDEIATFNFWVIDVQGAELKVLQGAGNLLELANTIVIEVKRVNDYLGGVDWIDLDTFLTDKGFFHLWEPATDTEDNIIYVRAK